MNQMLPDNLAKRRLASIPCPRRREFHVGCLSRLDRPTSSHGLWRDRGDEVRMESYMGWENNE